MKPRFTIFTPTYNRAEKLSKVFGSLKQQKLKDFEWLIYDDGSTDDTHLVVEGFKHELDSISDSREIFTLRYLRSKENKGKHAAWNYALECADGEFFTVLDSDDYLLPNAMDVLGSLSEKVGKLKDVAGFSFIHFADDVKADLAEYGGMELYRNYPLYEWRDRGEMGFCYKTAKAYQFPFPEFAGERFCPESLVHRRIVRQYKILYTDHVLMRGEYLSDGLSQDYWKRLLDNPRGALLTLSEKINEDCNNKTKAQQLLKNYFEILKRSERLTVMEKISCFKVKYFYMSVMCRLKSNRKNKL